MSSNHFTSSWLSNAGKILTISIICLIAIDLHAEMIKLQYLSETNESSVFLLLTDLDQKAEVVNGRSYAPAVQLYSANNLELSYPQPTRQFKVSLSNNRLQFTSKKPVKLSLTPSGAGNYLISISSYDGPLDTISEQSAPVKSEPKAVNQVNRSEPMETQQVQRQPEKAKNLLKNSVEQAENKTGQQDRAVNEDFSNYPYQISMGLTKIAEGDTIQGMKLLEVIDPASADYTQARLLLGDMYQELGKNSHAIESYKSTFHDSTKIEVAAIKLALLFQKLGRSEEAAETWEMVFELKSGNADSLFTALDQDVRTADLPKLPNRTDRLRFLYFLPILLAIGAIGGWYWKWRSDSRLMNLMDDMDELPVEEDEDTEEIEKEEDSVIEVEASETSDEASGAEDDLGLEDDLLSELSEDTHPQTASWDDEPPEEEPKLKKIEEMSKSGMSVKEIAEALNIGQDEVTMVLRLVSEDD